MKTIDSKFDTHWMPLTLSLVSGKWRLKLIETIGLETIRYGRLRARMVGISEKVLIAELKQLIEMGAVVRYSHPTIPPRVEYTLTEKGRLILPLIDSLKKLEQQLIAN